MTATLRTTPSKKMNLCFTFKVRTHLDLFSAPIADSVQYEKLAAVVRVPQTTLLFCRGRRVSGR